ncbi:MAG: segregation ATPase FtsK/SpoIIIE, family [Blastocatellia bacterium]|jgi:S-DNA-T family DNA segregation ATPase FtsK/SpoIIIE|nr:segregation ATPase FtsK/SpoIIIE, family [Blastocatellia bacterium]
MATISNEIDVQPEVRNSRLNEIIAIALIALALLLGLCLASYHPNDPSWNAAGESGAHNWIGAIGANVAAALFQGIGLAAYLLPFLLLAAAWRRFRSRRINAPLSRMTGLLVLVLSSSALLSLANIRPFFDASVNAGGLVGAIISRTLVAGLNTIGAAILLTAIAATGVLLATNFSFAAFYERLTLAVAARFEVLRLIPEKFRAWRLARHERKQQHLEMQRHAKPETGATPTLDAPGTQIVGEGRQGPTIGSGTDGNEVAAAFASFSAETTNGQKTMSAAAGAATAPTKRLPVSSRGKSTESAESALVEEMVREAAVKRRTETPATGALPFEGRRVSTTKTAASDYQLPSVDLLNEGPARREQADDELLNMATKLAEKCREFNVTGQIKFICPGPVVTTYEFKPDPGVKYSRVTGLVDDLCLALKAESIRIDRMPGKPHVGIEVPNPRRETIYLREVLESRAFKESPSKLTIAVGKTIDGLNYVSDLAKMPHLLIAGTTGAGKSVGVNALLVSILYRARPDEVKVILIDPKRLELGLYEDIPHLATPIIVDPKPASRALRWAVGEMERRYKELAGWGVRNIDGYNAERDRRNTVKDFGETGQPWVRMPYIVIIIDELADLMMTSGNEVEDAITRLAQMARAVGIHLVLATQRPSVDVITGLIKANFPSRMSYRVSSKIDSRTILDTNGAEHLLGKGDMLFLPPGSSRLLRVHGAYIDETEINKVVAHIKSQWEPDYDESITQSDEEAMGLEDSGGERDELFEDALRICVDMKRASTSVLQRRLRIGYGRAAAVLDQMEREGLIGKADGARPRPVLAKAIELVGEWEEQEASQ